MVTMQVLAPTSRPSRGRVALLVPRWTDVTAAEPQGTPFRSFTVGGALLDAGYEVVFFDQEHDLDRSDQFERLIEELRGATVAFIWMNEAYPTNQFVNAHMLATRLKQALASLTIVAGGEMITICPPEFFDLELPFDFLIRGSGEDSALRLLQGIEAGAMDFDIPGLCWREADGSLQHNPPSGKAVFRPEYLDLFRRLDLSDYIQTGGVLGNDQPTLSLATGRGCTKRCPFCCWSKHPARVGSARQLFELVVYLHERYGVRQFHNAELDFFFAPKRALEFADLLADSALDIGWFALGSPIDLMGLSDADWDRLQAGGLKKLELGSESGSDRVLASIGKRHTGEDLFTICVKMLERGIVPMNNFLFGFPGETSADRQATLRLIHRLIDISVDGNAFTYRHYQPVWGTVIGDQALAQVHDRPRRIDQWLAERPRFEAEDVQTMPWLPRADERELKRMINFDLPLATSCLAIPSLWRRSIYRRLRGRVRRDLRAGGGARLFDRWIYDRVVATQLDRTYIP